jgi:16S rRNA (cytosine1402-N4)-methyltransferase
LIIVSFQSLEDRIVKDFFNHNSGKRWRSSRHYPELVDEGPINFNIITKKPIRPSEREILNNPRSRSAKLRVGEKIH